jgi:hypothetical protein
MTSTPVIAPKPTAPQPGRYSFAWSEVPPGIVGGAAVGAMYGALTPWSAPRIRYALPVRLRFVVAGTAGIGAVIGGGIAGIHRQRNGAPIVESVGSADRARSHAHKKLFGAVASATVFGALVAPAGAWVFGVRGRPLWKYSAIGGAICGVLELALKPSTAYTGRR